MSIKPENRGEGFSKRYSRLTLRLSAMTGKHVSESDINALIRETNEIALYNLSGTPHRRVLFEFAKALADRGSSENVEQAFDRVKSELEALEGLWCYQPEGAEWRIESITGDGQVDTMAYVCSEALAQKIIAFFDNPESMPDDFTPGNADVPAGTLKVRPEGYDLTDGSDDEWDVLRCKAGGKDREWVATVCSEYLAVYTCRMIAGEVKPSIEGY